MVPAQPAYRPSGFKMGTVRLAEKKTFILGIGAQKSGTSWLHGYIAAHDAVDTGPTKEYHIWDALLMPGNSHFKVGFAEALLSRRKRLRRSLQKNPDSYFDYFETLLGKPGVEITADITPAYSALGAATYSRIYGEFARRGIDCKVVFLMRDPFERCWSAVRMHRKRGRPIENISMTLDEADVLRQYCRTEHAALRTRYDVTIGEIYEELFDAERIEEISRFIGIPPRQEFSSRKFNVTEKGSDLPEDIVRSVVGEYSQVYEFCLQRFPQTASLWIGHRYL